MNKKILIVIGIFILLVIGIIINSNKSLEDIDNISGIIAVENVSYSTDENKNKVSLDIVNKYDFIVNLGEITIVSYKNGELYDSYNVTLNDNINSGEKIHQEFYTDKSWSLANGLAIKTPNLKIINE